MRSRGFSSELPFFPTFSVLAPKSFSFWQALFFSLTIPIEAEGFTVVNTLFRSLFSLILVAKVLHFFNPSLKALFLIVL